MKMTIKLILPYLASKVHHQLLTVHFQGDLIRNKNKIFVLISIIVILFLVDLYLSHKNKKDTYIDTQKDRIDLYFKYNLTY